MGEMKLAELFQLQSTLNKRVGLNEEYFAKVFVETPLRNADLIKAGQWIDDMLKAMSSEIEELRNCCFWKHWCSEAQEGERYKIKDLEAARKEVIDILHLWISLCQILGMSADMVGDLYETKLAKNIKRQDDGYSIEVKDLAWKLFRDENPKDHPQNMWPKAESLEDLPDDIAAYYLNWGKGAHLCDTCINAENDCSMAVGVTHSCIRYKRKSDIPVVPNCSKCGRKCKAGHAMTGEGPVCGSCV